MTDQLIKSFITKIEQQFPTSDTIDDAIAAVKKDIGFELSLPQEEAFAKATEHVKNDFTARPIPHLNSIIEPSEDWYQGPTHKDIHWPSLKKYLSDIKHWDKETILSIDESSSEVVSLLANPKQQSFKHRGLVVGHVQSGKTANMTAVIAKAVDAGYNLIVLLGGMTKKLRAQTQGRIENDVVNLNRSHWNLLTSLEDDGDFVMPLNKSFTHPHENNVQLVIMKKVTSRLRDFRNTILNLDEHGKIITQTPDIILNQLKVLIIDDECDQASVNSSIDEFNITKINHEIRKIIQLLPAVSYVGYTATPFANVFINPYKQDDQLDDLYPENFITALPRSNGYFGAREIFGTEPTDADKETQDEEGRNIIREVPISSLSNLQPASSKDQTKFQPQLTDELENSILWFFITCAIRRYRQQEEQHMTMLIHTSPNIAQHKNMATLIKTWLTDNRTKLLNTSDPIFTKMKSLFEMESQLLPLRDSEAINFNTIHSHMDSVLEKLEIVIENGESDERLNYANSPKTYIVIGGTVLARGLTLEGLSVSFFLRTSKQYDTLLQMGRWFGYRHGYEDLARLWTTTGLASKFRALSYIEEEIREDISKYQAFNMTPKEFAIRVRSIPGMAITAASKMKNAYLSQINYAGRHVQTIRYDHQNASIIKNNWSTAVALINKLEDSWEAAPKAKNGYLAKNVPLQSIQDFLNSYHICKHHLSLNNKILLDYINEARDDLQQWNVGIITPNSTKKSEKHLGVLGKVGINNRSQLISSEECYADIKALMSKKDLLIDVDSETTISQDDSWDKLKGYRPEVPLLLIYIIDADSKPRENSGSRTNLNAIGDLIGIGIVFPGHTSSSDKYYSVQLEAAIEDGEEGDDEEENALMNSILTE